MKEVDAYDCLSTNFGSFPRLTHLRKGKYKIILYYKATSYFSKDFLLNII